MCVCLFSALNAALVAGTLRVHGMSCHVLPSPGVSNLAYPSPSHLCAPLGDLGDLHPAELPSTHTNKVTHPKQIFKPDYATGEESGDAENGGVEPISWRVFRKRINDVCINSVVQ